MNASDRFLGHGETARPRAVGRAPHGHDGAPEYDASPYARPDDDVRDDGVPPGGKPRPGPDHRRWQHRDAVVVHVRGSAHAPVHVEVNVNMTLADWYGG